MPSTETQPPAAAAGAPAALVVGGSAATRHHLTAVLASHGYAVWTGPGTTTLEAAPPTVAVVVQLWEGQDRAALSAALRRLRAAGHGAPIILVGPRMDDATRAQAFAGGVADVIALPADPRAIAARVGAAIAAHRPPDG